ncbi:MAG: NAD-dependent epimerase/dehydratase family protein [Verrucomicrobiota bacterium]
MIWIFGAGYVGAALAKRVSSRDTVLALTLSRESADSLNDTLPSGATAAVADLTQPDSLRRLSQTFPVPDALVHCASSGRGGAEAYRSVYLGGCEHLLELFPNVPLLFTSSTSVYPQTSGEVVDESSSAQPSRETGKLLRQAENLVLPHHGIVARLAGIYGPDRSVLLKKILEGTAVIESGTSRYLNQIHRDDAASAIDHLLTQGAPGTIYNVCDGNHPTQREVTEALAHHFGKPMPPEKAPDLNRKRGWTHKRVSSQKLRDLGWKPSHPSYLESLLSSEASPQ